MLLFFHPPPPLLSFSLPLRTGAKVPPSACGPARGDWEKARGPPDQIVSLQTCDFVDAANNSNEKKKRKKETGDNDSIRRERGGAEGGDFVGGAVSERVRRMEKGAAVAGCLTSLSPGQKQKKESSLIQTKHSSLHPHSHSRSSSTHPAHSFSFIAFIAFIAFHLH